MNKEKQKEFYAAFGKVLTAERKRRRLTQSQLARKAGQQFITIQRIEEGKHFEFHNVVWMMNYLGLDFTAILIEINGGFYVQENTRLSDFI